MYAYATPYDRYRQQGVMTANPVELIVMLYDGCIKRLKMAAISIEEKQIDKANESLQKAEEIVMELVNSLDLNYPISDELLNLYDFILNEMIQINIEKDANRIDPIVEILSTLRQTWNQISKQARGVASLVEE